MSRALAGLALLVLLGGHHAVARAEVGSDVSFDARSRVALAFEPGEAAAIADAPRYTPVVMAVLAAAPHPVIGSDARTHLVYEVQLTNASPAARSIAAIEVLDGDDPEWGLLAIEGDEVAGKVQALEPNAEIPRCLVHRLTLDLPEGLPDDFRVFAGLPLAAEVLEELGAQTAVADQEPAALGPPLRGDG